MNIDPLLLWNQDTMTTTPGLGGHTAPDPPDRPALHSPGQQLRERGVACRASAAVLGAGVKLSMALGRCALAEKEHDDCYWEYWAQAVESAEAVRVSWEGLIRLCRQTGTAVERLMGPCGAGDVLDTVIDMATAVIKREDALSLRREEQPCSGQGGTQRVGLGAERARARAARAEAYACELRQEWDSRLGEE